MVGYCFLFVPPFSLGSWRSKDPKVSCMLDAPQPPKEDEHNRPRGRCYFRHFPVLRSRQASTPRRLSGWVLRVWGGRPGEPRAFRRAEQGLSARGPGHRGSSIRGNVFAAFLFGPLLPTI